jgi:hypothetical protein
MRLELGKPNGPLSWVRKTVSLSPVVPFTSTLSISSFVLMARGTDHLDPALLHSIRVRYGRLVAKGFAANPAPEVGKRSGYEKKAFNLLVRLDGQRADVLRFMCDAWNIPLDCQHLLAITPRAG